MSTLVCGSIAFDTTMKFPERFKDYIIADQIHDISVCFVSPEMRREFGGAAGNIAYNLKLLGGEPLLMGTVGHDFKEYRDWLRKCGIIDTFVREIPDLFTAQCVITTDLDNNQLTSFHPGAMGEAHTNHVAEVQNVSLAIVAPDGKQAMLQHAADLSALSVPFIFDPGQNLPLFSRAELLQFIDQATWLIVNNYESNLLIEITEGSVQQHALNLQALIVTHGAEGSTIYYDKSELIIPPVKASKTLDPTGCGDAYRAGILYGLQKGWNWDQTGKLASLLGALNVEHHGTQNHSYENEELKARYEETFRGSFPT